MPIHRSPQRLKTLALQSICLNFEIICYGKRFAKGSKELAAYIDNEGYKLIPGPFTDWPSTMLEDLIDALYRHRCGHQHLLHCAIQPQMTRCTILLHGSIHVAMTLITGRCANNLKYLELNHSKNVPAGFYCGFFKKFINLTVLSIYNSLVDDTGFRSIGECMPNIVEINAGRTWITNSGMKALCIDEDQEAGRGEIAVYRCQKLVVLNVTGTRVTQEGVSLFVVCHPNLIRIDHEESFHGLALAQQIATYRRQKDFNCMLKSLVTTQVCLTPSAYEFAIDSCPLVEEIVIQSAGLTDENLYRLMNLSRLTSLHLGNKMATSFNFFQGLAPVLDVVGKMLKKLVLEDFTEIDVQLIGSCCPNLEHLALSGTTTYAPISNIQPGQFSKLKKLELWNRNNQWGSNEAYNFSICSTTLKQLAFFAKELDFLLLYKVDSMTDGLFYDISQQNPLRRLKNVVFDHCQGITSATIWKLLESPNELSVLRCWHCGGVSVQTRDEVKNVIKEDNLMLYWEWYAFIENEDEIAAALAAAELAEAEEDSEEEA